MKRQKGFTLIELLIVVAIIGIIAAIAIPNLINAIQRGRQKRTMGDIRTLSTCVEAYATDWAFYPKVADGIVPDLLTYTVPTYLRKLPARDGWNNELNWGGTGAQTGGRVYSFWSFAKDGGSGAPVLVNNGGPKTDFNADIVYSNGTFIQWPEGMQVD
jgi:general secretion pathway protein G